MLKLDLKTLNWTLVDNYGDIPGVRMGHSASLYQDDKLLVYGGENEHREYLSDVVILDLKTHHWTQPELRGPIPRGRARHAAVVYEDKLFVIGGLTGETNWILDDICYLDLKTWTWSRTWTFVGRFDHTAWIWGGRLWVLGGLGTEMERSTDICWLDLKGSPNFNVPARGSSSGGLTSSRIPSSASGLGGHGAFASRNDTYAANSGSVQVRPGRNKPNAPGAVSSLRFVSGPHVPPQASGTHFHVCSSGSLLDFVTPAATIRSSECSLSSLELDSLRWQRLVDGLELFDPGFRWHYCTINEDGTKVWLLGSPIEAGLGGNQDAQLSEVLAIDLKKYGLLGNDVAVGYGPSSEQSRILAAEHSKASSQGLGADLAATFDQPPESGNMADFIVTANNDGEIEDGSDGQSPVRFSIGSTSQSPLFVSESSTPSPPIHTHKMILQARWPHFKRMYASKMKEYHNQSMHIPEPYSVVRAFLFYLYTDSIAPSEYCRTLIDVAGMLVMANLYDMPKLRLLCVHRLSREIDIEHAAIVWERAGRTDEEWLKLRAARYCLTHWGRVVRTEGFRTLSRQNMVELCEVVDTEGRVVGGEELEAAGSLYGGFGDTGSGRRGRHMADTDETGDEEDGMEIS